MRFLLVFLVGCGGTDFKGFDEAGASDGSSKGDASANDGSPGADDGGKDGATCEGTHPIVDGGARYCSTGNCYCMPSDKCLPASNAQACCTVQVKCAN